MATAYSTLLGLALPVQGELSGTWGDTVNAYITNYLDAAVAGAQTLSTDADVTLTKTTGTALGSTSSQYAILNCTGSRTVLRTITAPAASKIYVVINQTTGGFGVKLVGSGPTTGITVAAGTKALVAWNGSDFAFVSSTDIAQLTGTLGAANGGTGVATLTGVAYGNGTSAFTAATGSQIATAIGSTAVTNATNATNAAVTAQSASATYQLVGTSSTTTGNAALSISSTTKPLTFNPSTGDFVAAGNVSAYSDERLKTDWADMPDGFLQMLSAVKTGTYTRIDGGERQVGVSAQSLQSVLPQAVVETESGMLSVAYGNAALAACVMLARKVAELEARIAALGA